MGFIRNNPFEIVEREIPMGFTWNASYSVGNDNLDGQHKELFAIINKLNNKPSQDVLAQCLDDLLDYVSYHFDEEIAILESANYPDLKAHEELHKAFTAKVEQKVNDFEMGHLSAEDLHSFLGDWLIQHIKGTDKKYSTFVQ